MQPSERLATGKESDIQEVRNQTIQALQYKYPIIIQKCDSLGDRLIVASAAHYVLRNLCVTYDIPFTNINLHERTDLYSDSNEVNLGQKTNEIAGIAENKRNPHLFHGEIERYATALAVQLPLNYSKQVPLPVRTNVSPFSEYNEEIVRMDVQELQATLEGRELILLIQTGSEEYKRLNDNQMLLVANVLRDCYPNGYLVAISDRNFSNRQGKLGYQKQPLYSNAVDSVFVKDDINKRIAYGMLCQFGACTDSAGAWILAASMALANIPIGELPPDRLVNLYTIGIKEAHEITGAIIVESDALVYYREEFRGDKHLDFKNGHPLTRNDYENYYTHISFAGSDSFHKSEPHIAEADVLKLIKTVRSNAQSRRKRI